MAAQAGRWSWSSLQTTRGGVEWSGIEVDGGE